MTAQELLTEILVANNEFNIKLFILGILFLYSVMGIYFSRLQDTDRHYMIFLKTIIFRIPSYIMLFLFPLFSAFLYRDVSSSIIYGFVVGFYGLYFTIMFALFVFYGADFVLRIFGMDIGTWKDVKRSYKTHIIRR